MNSQALETAAASAFEASQSDSTAQTTDSTQVEQTSAAPQMIGVEPEQAQTQQQIEWQLAQGIDPTTVLGKFGDKDLTAAELKDAIMLRADHTRKTQELATQRQSQQEAIDFYESNRDYLTRLQADDVNERKAVLQEIAKNFGVDLTPKARDEQGRFTSQGAQDELLYDLAQISDPDEHAFAQRHNRTVEAAQAANARVDKLEGILSQLVNGVTSAQQQMQQTHEAEAIATDWKAKGVENIDIQGALGFVAKGLSMEDAMFLANKQAILAHNARVAQGAQTQRPNEPGGTTAKNGFDGSGMSLEQFARARLTG